MSLSRHDEERTTMRILIVAYAKVTFIASTGETI